MFYTRKDGKLIMALFYSSFIFLRIRSFDEKQMENGNFNFWSDFFSLRAWIITYLTNTWKKYQLYI